MDVREKWREWFDGYDGPFVDDPLFRGLSRVEQHSLVAYLAAWRAARDEAVRCIPTTWLDPLLTGPSKIIPTEIAGVPVQDLLNALRERIRATLGDAPLATNDARREGA